MAGRKHFVGDASPWLPISNPVDLMHLGKLVEETTECATAAARCMIQGMDEAEPSTGEINRHWLEKEIADVLANIELTCEHFNLNRTLIDERKTFKKSYLRNWHQLPV